MEDISKDRVQAECDNTQNIANSEQRNWNHLELNIHHPLLPGPRSPCRPLHSPSQEL